MTCLQWDQLIVSHELAQTTSGAYLSYCPSILMKESNLS